MHPDYVMSAHTFVRPENTNYLQLLLVSSGFTDRFYVTLYGPINISRLCVANQNAYYALETGELM